MDSTTTYKALVSKDGKAKMIDVQKRELGDDEVFIKIESSPINPADRFMVMGLYGETGNNHKLVPYSK